MAAQTSVIEVERKNSGFFALLLATLAVVTFFFVITQPQTHAATTVGTSNTTIVPNGLVGHWTFDGKDMTNTTALDKSGQGNTGTLTNMTAWSGATIGKSGQALRFNGSNNYFTIPTISLSTLSFSFWTKTSNSSQTGIIFGDTGAGLSSGNKVGFASNNVFIRAGGSAYTGIPMPTDGKWHHWVVTRDASNSWNLYRDNVLVSIGTSPGSSTYNVNTISANGGDKSQLWDGGLDDVRIYNRAITSNEIQALYKAGGGVKIDAAERVVFITTPGSSTWTVPSGVSKIKVEAIGAGGGGGSGTGSGGGGGAYAVKRDISVTPGSTISVNVGTGGAVATAGTDTTLNTSVVVAKGGAAGVNGSGASVSGGLAASSIPTLGAFSGGNGGGNDPSYNSGGAGGGAASYLGAGGNSGGNGSSKGGAGGGGSGGGSAGGNSVGGGAFGGGNNLGVGGGTPPAGNGSNGGSGVGHSAGGGAGGFSNFNSSSLWIGGNGGNGAEWDITHGSGAGGGGGGANGGSAGGVGGNGGNYGGGGGGGGLGVSGGTGGNGLIVISYKVGQTVTAVTPTNASGLVGHWTFDGKNMTNATATDSSGNGNNGTLVNMTTRDSATIGKLGQGLNFGGTSEYVYLGSSKTYVTTGSPYVISFWMYPTDFSSTQRSVYSLKSNSSEGWVGFLINDGSYADFTFAKDSASSFKFSFPSSIVNKWWHVAIVYNGSGFNTSTNYLVYLNGIPVTVNASGAILSGSNESVIGLSIPYPGTRNYKGKLDDFRVYNRALSASEIKGLYKLGGR